MTIEDRIVEVLREHIPLKDWPKGLNARDFAAALVAELEPIPNRIFTDDRGCTWEWCGGVPGTWAWRMTRIGEPDDHS